MSIYSHFSHLELALMGKVRGKIIFETEAYYKSLGDNRDGSCPPAPLDPPMIISLWIHEYKSRKVYNPIEVKES